MMAKTNLDDLDLETPGIEADEINAESAAAGRALIAGVDGAAVWGSPTSVIYATHSSEDTLAHNVWTAMEDTQEEHAGPGFSINEDGDIVVGEELDGRAAMIFVCAGVTTAVTAGWFEIQPKVQYDGEGTFYSMPAWSTALSDQATVVAQGFVVRVLEAGDVIRTQVRFWDDAATGTGDLNVEVGSTIILAF